MDNVIISSTVDDEEALVDKASSCTSRRRRLVRHQVLVSTVVPELTNSSGRHSLIKKI